MEIRNVIYFDILLAGILLARKAAWGRISRRTEKKPAELEYRKVLTGFGKAHSMGR